MHSGTWFQSGALNAAFDDAIANARPPGTICTGGESLGTRDVVPIRTFDGAARVLLATILAGATLETSMAGRNDIASRASVTAGKRR